MNPELAESELEKELREMPSVRFAKIKDKFYKDLDIEYDIVVDSKQNNQQLQLSNTINVLNTLASNPLALNDPRFKVMVYEFMRMSGINPIKLQEADQQAQANPMLQGLQIPQGGENQQEASNIPQLATQ